MFGESTEQQMAACEERLTAIESILAAQGKILNQILSAVSSSNLQGEIKTLMLDITALTAAVANETTVEASAETLLTNISAELQTLIANSGNTVDPAALAAIVATINANSSNLAQAVVTATPAATPTTPPPASVIASAVKA
jgi:hypothetical protein